MLRLGVGVGSDIQEKAVLTRRRRDDGADRGTIDAGNAVQPEECGCHHGAAVPSADETIDASVLDHRAGPDNRRVLLSSHRLRRMLIHRDDLGGVLDLRPLAGARCRERAVDLVLDAHEDHFDPELTMRLDAAGHHLVGGEITTHRIERDFHWEAGLQRLDVQVAHGLGVRLDESLAGIDVGAHQHVEDLVRLDRIFDLDAEQHPVLWVHGRFPQLVGVHLTETFVAGDLRLSRHLGQLPILLLFGVGVTDLFAARDLVERRLCDVQIFAGDHLRHVAKEKCQQQCTNVRTIYVSVGHYQYMVISEFTDIKLLADTGPERGDEVTDLL